MNAFLGRHRYSEPSGATAMATTRGPGTGGGAGAPGGPSAQGGSAPGVPLGGKSGNWWERPRRSRPTRCRSLGRRVRTPLGEHRCLHLGRWCLPVGGGRARGLCVLGPGKTSAMAPGYRESTESWARDAGCGTGDWLRPCWRWVTALWACPLDQVSCVAGTTGR